MSEPKDDKKKGEKEEKGEKGGEPTLNFLKVDRSLRPDGMHFDAEMGKSG